MLHKSLAILNWNLLLGLLSSHKHRMVAHHWTAHWHTHSHSSHTHRITSHELRTTWSLTRTPELVVLVGLSLLTGWESHHLHGWALEHHLLTTKLGSSELRSTKLHGCSHIPNLGRYATHRELSIRRTTRLLRLKYIIMTLYMHSLSSSLLRVTE